MRIFRARLWANIFLAVLSAELALQAGAFGYRRWAALARRSAVTDAETTILCVGDSHTFGLGAPAEHSYPRQLERMLSERWPDRRVRVINAGVPGRSASEVLRDLPGQMDRFRPDAVIVWVGLNDWVREEDLAVPERDWRAWRRRIALRLDRSLYVSKLYRLVKMVYGMAANQAARAVALRENVPLIADEEELARRFKDSWGQLISADGHHPSAQGYALIAEAVFERLADSGWLKGSLPSGGES